jgi:hypothetical protein
VVPAIGSREGHKITAHSSHRAHRRRRRCCCHRAYYPAPGGKGHEVLLSARSDPVLIPTRFCGLEEVKRKQRGSKYIPTTKFFSSRRFLPVRRLSFLPSFPCRAAGVKECMCVVEACDDDDDVLHIHRRHHLIICFQTSSAVPWLAFLFAFYTTAVGHIIFF